jgi:hypothetical protein
LKFFFGLLAFIAAVVVVVLLVVGLFRSFNSDETGNPVTSTYDLSDKTSVDTVARYTISGPIVADENYKQARITISKNTRTIEVLKGYAGKVEKTATLPNTEAAYTAFLSALRAAQFGSKREGVSTDPSTVCVTGNKFFYELALASEKKVDSWTSNCTFKDGTFAGNPQGTAQLFQAQIPNYREITNGVNLASL